MWDKGDMGDMLDMGDMGDMDDPGGLTFSHFGFLYQSPQP